MGDIKIGNLNLSSAFIGSTEIQKIYVGNVKVYEKYVPPTGVTVSYATNLESGTTAHNNCTVSPAPSYTFSGSTTIEVTPRNITRLSDGICIYFAYFHVGTSNSYSSADVINYNFDNHINTFVTGHGAAVTFDDTHGDVYATFVYKEVDFSPEKDTLFTVALTARQRTGATTFDINAALGSIFPTSGTYGTFSGRKIRITGALGVTDTPTPNDTAFDETLVFSNGTTIATANPASSITLSLSYLGGTSNRYSFGFTASSTFAAAATFHVIIYKLQIM